MTTLALDDINWKVYLAEVMRTARRGWFADPAQTLDPSADAELVTAHLAGEPGAFAELVKRYTSTLYNVAYRFTNDASEAENLTQEAFLRAWHVLPRLKLDKPLKPYLVKITVNLCHDWAERKGIPEIVPLERQEEKEPADETGDPLAAVSAEELRERVRSKLQELPPLYRTVIALRYTEEMSYEEMATALDLPINTVRTHLHRAKGKLREWLENEV